MSTTVSILIRCDEEFDSIVSKLEGVLGRPAIRNEEAECLDLFLLGVLFVVHEMEWEDDAGSGMLLSRYPVTVTLWKRRSLPPPGDQLEFRKLLALAVAQGLSDVLPGVEFLVVEDMQVFLARLGGT